MIKMKKTVLLIAICGSLLLLFGCTPKAAQKDVPFEISGMSAGLGSTSSENLDESRYTYTISLISGQKEIKDVRTVEIVTGDKLFGKVTEQAEPKLTPFEKYIEIEGTIIFDSKGLSKEEIGALSPYITALTVTCADESEITVPVSFGR